MLFSFTSRVISALAAFLYPGYASYKTLSQRPASEAELERWLMYWSVLGCIVGVEYVAEWMVSWIPLYSTIKAIFLLYLALPQTQGATYVYTVHLRPFFATHERQIDQAIAEVRVRIYRFLQEKARAVWAALINALAPGAAGAAGIASTVPTTDQPPPTMNNPAGGPSQLLSSLWTSYGPGIIAGGAALLNQTAAATLPSRGAGDASGSSNAAPGASHFNTPPGSKFNSRSNTVDTQERRRQLEAELAALAPVAMPTANNPARASQASLTQHSNSSSDSNTSLPGLRERNNSSGKFEEIKGDDVEGYEVDEDEHFVGGFVTGGASTSKAGTGGGWFGWGGSGSGSDKGRGGYERVKSD